MVKTVGIRAPERQHQGSWQDYLDPGEKLLWQGAPAGGIRFSITGLVQSAFGVFFLGFSVFWVAMALNIGADGPLSLFFPLFGLPFVLIGLWLVIGHWFFDAYKRRRSRYALTNKRAIIARRVFGRRLESYPILADSEISLVEGRFDTVNFHQKTVIRNNGTSRANIGFRYIRDGRKVYNLLLDIKTRR